MISLEKNIGVVKKRILLVDDEIAILKLLEFILKKDYELVIKNNGFQKRLPNILQNDLKNALTNSQGENCYNNIHNCKFNTSSNKKIFLIGDSHMEYIMSDLKNKVVQEGYQFIPSVVSSCIFFPNFNLINLKTKKISPNCNNNYFQMIKKLMRFFIHFYVY